MLRFTRRLLGQKPYFFFCSEPPKGFQKFQRKSKDEKSLDNK